VYCIGVKAGPTRRDVPADGSPQVQPGELTALQPAAATPTTAAADDEVEMELHEIDGTLTGESTDGDN